MPKLTTFRVENRSCLLKLKNTIKDLHVEETRVAFQFIKKARTALIKNQIKNIQKIK